MPSNRRRVLGGIGTLIAATVVPAGTALADGHEETAGLRVAHASPDAPAVDVTVNDNALTLFEGLSYSESSGYAVVPAGQYEVEIRPAGGGDPVFEADVSLSGGSTYTAFAIGYLSPDDEPANKAFGLELTEDVTAPPRGDGGEEEDDEEGGEDREEEGEDGEDRDDDEPDDKADDESAAADADDEGADAAEADGSPAGAAPDWAGRPT